MHGWGRAAAAAVLAVLLSGCGPPAAPEGVPAGAVTPALTGLPVGAHVDYQLGGAYPPAADVDGVVRDSTAEPAPGRWSACYVNAFQTQPDASGWPEELLLHDGSGARVADPDWPGEFLLDVSTDRRRAGVLAVLGPVLDACATAGFDAVEPDNLDSWTRSGGLLTPDDAVAMARLLVARAHAAGLVVGQKNAAELAPAGIGFDYAVTEDCGRYDECGAFTSVYGTVLDVEYSDEGFTRACRTPGLSAQRRDLGVVVPGDPDYRAAWCPAR